MKNFTSRLLATLLAVMMVIVAACTANDDEGIIPVTSTQAMIDLSTALSGNAQIVSAVTADEIFVITLDNGSEYSFAHDNCNVYTVSSSGVWQLNESNVSGSPYYSTLRAQSSSDTEPVDGSKATDPELEGRTLYWIAAKNSNGSWLWNPYMTDTGEYYSNTILYLSDTPDLIYNSQVNSLTLVVNGQVEVYEAQSGSGDTSLDGDTLKTLVSTDFVWNYNNALADSYSYNISVTATSSTGLTSTQREALTATSKDPIITIEDVDTGEGVDPDLYGFVIDETNAGDYSDPYITISTTNKLNEARKLYVRLTYENLADDGIADLIITLPIAITGAPTANYGYVKSVDYSESLEDYWSITNELYSDVYYGCTWSDNYLPEMFDITEDMVDSYVLAKLETPFASLVFDETYTFSIDGGEALATLSKESGSNSFGLDLDANSIADKLVGVQMDFSYEVDGETKYVTLTDPDSGFTMVMNPSFFTINNGDCVSLSNSGSVFTWDFTTSYNYATQESADPYETGFMSLTADSNYSDVATQLYAYVTKDGGFESSMILSEASTGSTTGLNYYKASDFAFEVDVNEKNGRCYINVVGNSIMANDGSFSIFITLPDAYTTTGGDTKDIVITAPLTIVGAPKLYATYTLSQSQNLLGNMIYSASGVSYSGSAVDVAMVGGIHGLSKYESTSSYDTGLYVDTAAPDGYDSVNDIWTQFADDRTMAESIIEACVRGDSFSPTYNKTLGVENPYVGLNYVEFDYADLTTPVKFAQNASGLGYTYGYDANRLVNLVKTHNFYGGAASSSMSNIYCTNQLNVESVHPSGFTYTAYSLGVYLRMYYMMTANTDDRFDEDGFAFVEEDGILDGIYSITAISSSSAAQLADLIIRYEIVGAPSDGSVYPVINTDADGQYILDMKGRTDLTSLTIAAYLVMPLDYTDKELTFHDGASSSTKSYAYQTFTLAIDEGFTGVVVNSESTASSSTNFVWDYDSAAATNPSYSVEDFLISGNITDTEYARIYGGTGYPVSIEVTSTEENSFGETVANFDSANISVEMLSDMYAKVTLSGDTLAEAKTVTFDITYTGAADNGNDVIITFTANVEGEPAVTVDETELILDVSALSGSQAPYTTAITTISDAFGDEPSWIGAVNATTIASAMVVSYDDNDDDADDYALLNVDGVLTLQFNSNEYGTYKSFSNVVLTHPTTGLTVTYSSIVFELVDETVVSVGLADDADAPTLTWMYATAKDIVDGVNNGTAYTTSALALDSNITSDIYTKIIEDGITPKYTVSGSASSYYKDKVSVVLGGTAASYTATLSIVDKMSDAGDIKVTASYVGASVVDGVASDVSVIIPVTIVGAPIFGDSAPYTWSTSLTYAGSYAVFGSGNFVSTKTIASSEWTGGGYLQFGETSSATTSTYLDAAVLEMYSEYSVLPTSTPNGYFSLMNRTKSTEMGVGAMLDGEKISAELLAMEYTSNTKTIASDSELVTFTDPYYEMVHATGFEARVASCTYSALIFNTYLTFGSAFNDEGTEASLTDIYLDLNTLFTITNSKSTNCTTEIDFAVTDNSGVTVNSDGTLSWNGYEGDVNMTATVVIRENSYSIANGDDIDYTGQEIKVHTYAFKLVYDYDASLYDVTETEAEFTWNYAMSYAGDSYSTTVKIDNSNITGSISTSATWSASFADNNVAISGATVDVSKVAQQTDGSYRATVTVSGCNMATSASSLTLSVSDISTPGNSFTIPVSIVGAPTATISLAGLSATTSAVSPYFSTSLVNYLYEYSDYSNCLMTNFNGATLGDLLSEVVWSADYQEDMFDGDMTAFVAAANAMTLESSSDNSYYVTAGGEITTSDNGTTLCAEFMLSDFAGDGVLYPVVVYNKDWSGFKYSYSAEDVNGKVTFGTSASIGATDLGTMTSPVITDQSGLKITVTTATVEITDYDDYIGDQYPSQETGGSTGTDDATAGGNNPA